MRLGKRVKLMHPGIHFKLPIVDVVYLQSIRLRLTAITKQTVSTHSGQVVTLSGALGYRIDDILKLYNSIHHAEDTLCALARSHIAEYISTHDLEDCHPKDVEAAVNGELDFARYGLADTKIYINEFAMARTYRIIGDQIEYFYGRRLATDVPCTSPSDPT